MRDHAVMALHSKAPTAATLHRLEVFGRAILGLLECKRCFVFTLSQETEFASQAVRIGYNCNAQPSADVITRLAQRPEWQAANLFSVNPTDIPAAELLGRKHEEPPHALAGRLPAGNGEEVLFIAGWRATPFSTVEAACFSRAARIIWATMQALRHRPSDELSPDRLVAELAFPAFSVDYKWRVMEANEAGRQLLLAKSPVRLDHGMLVGPNSFVNNMMQQALRDMIASRSERAWASTLIPLSTDHRSFAFAWIGIAPAERQHSDRLLVVIPKLDAMAGAKRIATTFHLSWAEERIVQFLLRGEPPAGIGRHLDLTEATVRTYIKRIMLKLGINRQVEFFLLYILTQSPILDGCHDLPLAGVLESRASLITLNQFRRERA